MHKNGRRTADVVAVAVVAAAVGNVGNMIVSIHLCGSDYFVHMPEGRKEGLSKLDCHPPPKCILVTFCNMSINRIVPLPL